MSRSKHSYNFKSPGYDYWSRRPGSAKGGACPGRWSKKMNTRLERIQAKDEIKKQLDE